jgi:hypothetical protein
MDEEHPFVNGTNTQTIAKWIFNLDTKKAEMKHYFEDLKCEFPIIS